MGVAAWLPNRRGERHGGDGHIDDIDGLPHLPAVRGGLRARDRARRHQRRQRVTRIRGDRDDVFSHGFICPKGSTLKQLHEDPDWLRRPLVKRDGALRRGHLGRGVRRGRAAACGRCRRGARPRRAGHLPGQPQRPLAGRACSTCGRSSGRSAPTNVFSASTVDQRPKEVASGLMFGGALTVPVPDVDRTDFLLMLGANPYASNGSLATAPDWPGRLEALIARGGTLVVVDPRRSRTAEEATQHVAIRPGRRRLPADGARQRAGAPTGLVDTGRGGRVPGGRRRGAGRGRALHPRGRGRRDRRRRRDHPPPRPRPGGGPDGLRLRPHRHHHRAVRHAHVVAGRRAQRAHRQPRPARRRHVHRGGGRRRQHPGHTPRRPGRQARAAGTAGCGACPRRWASCRWRAWPRRSTRPGEGQIRALVTVAGNPVLSTPNAGRLDAALATLDFYVAVDPYVNETTRHADVILPPAAAAAEGPLRPGAAAARAAQRGQLQPARCCRSTTASSTSGRSWPGWRWSPRAWAPTPIRRSSTTWSCGRWSTPRSATRHGPDRRPRPRTRSSPCWASARGPERLIDLMLRTGPYGDGFGAARTASPSTCCWPTPHGVDLGPLEPRLPDVLRTPSGMVELAPEPIVADVARLRGRPRRPGRRAARSSAGATCAPTTRGCTTSRCW